MQVVIDKSQRKDKKLKATANGKTVHFGAKGYSDYPTHKDSKRKERYLARHKGEDWSKDNMMSAAFMSRYVLWGEPSLEKSVEALNKRYKDVHFKLKRT